MRIVTVLTIIAINANFGHSQCRLTTKTGNYDAICFQKLSKDNSVFFGAEISIVRNNKSGFVVVKLPFSDVRFKGKAYLYLEGEKIITLIDRGQQWKVNGELYGQFSLTEKEVLSLQESNISAVRFWACHEYEDCNDASEYYNKDSTDTFTHSKITKIDFPLLVSLLFEK